LGFADLLSWGVTGMGWVSGVGWRMAECGVRMAFLLGSHADKESASERGGANVDGHGLDGAVGGDGFFGGPGIERPGSQFHRGEYLVG